ncbi:MAG: anaerobic ribonucleoside-triphosphate reductase activating protein [bacterium]
MMIRGLQLLSMVDFPGEVCTTVFYGGCNFRCPWCHNGDLVLRPDTFSPTEPEELLAVLLRRKNWIQGVCISGGEPTLAASLPGLIKALKEHSFRIKLDTNGTNPQVLAQLLKDNLLDYVAMDIKAPPAKYDLLTGVKVDLNMIEESIALLQGSTISYEFRTTVVPRLLQEEDLLAIGRWLEGNSRYVLQQFRPHQRLLDPAWEPPPPYPIAFLYHLAAKLSEFFPEVVVRE